MKYLLTGAAALVLLTACGKKDKDVSDPTPAGIEFLNAKTSAIKVRKGDAATASDALAAFSLLDSQSGRVSYSDKTVKGASATFKNVKLTPSTAGAAGSVRIGDDDDRDFADAGMMAETLTFDGLAMVDGKANFGRMLLSNISVEPKDDDDTSVTKIKSIELVNPSPETAAWVASLFGKGEPTDMPEGAALSFDKWAMDSLTASIDDEDGTEGRFVIDKIEVLGLKNEKAESMVLKNLDFNMLDEKGATTRASIANMTVRGADFATFAARDEGVKSGIQKGVMQAMKNDPANPGFDLIQLDKLKASIGGADIDMPKLVSKVGRDKQGRAVKVVTEPFKMTLKSADDQSGEFFSGQLAALGYDKMVISGQGDQVYDPDTDTVTMIKGKNYWELEDGFRLDFSAKYAGAAAMADAMDDEEIRSNASPRDALAGALDTLILHNFEIALDDNGFFNRAFNAYATQAGQDPEQLRAQLVGMSAMAPMMSGQMGLDPALVTEATTALTGFLQDPKTLTIRIAPEQPISAAELSNLKDPSELTKKRLGFSASNK